MSKRRGERGSGMPEPPKDLAAENAALRRALQREVAQRKRLQKELGQDVVHLPDAVNEPDMRLQKIHAAGRHLLELINAVLDLSKIEAGKMELYLETFDVPLMVRDIAAVVQPLAEKNGNRIEARCDEAIDAMRADLTKVRQALFNLLSNSCKFTDHGTVALEVAREAVDGADWLRFAVSDTGIGMTPEQVSRLSPRPMRPPDGSTAAPASGSRSAGGCAG
jgi:signal transduction histidine kinase